MELKRSLPALIVSLMGLLLLAACDREGILVTQESHLPRAMFMCDKENVDPAGLAVNHLGILSSRCAV